MLSMYSFFVFIPSCILLFYVIHPSAHFSLHSIYSSAHSFTHRRRRCQCVRSRVWRRCGRACATSPRPSRSSPPTRPTSSRSRTATVRNAEQWVQCLQIAVARSSQKPEDGSVRSGRGGGERGERDRERGPREGGGGSRGERTHRARQPRPPHSGLGLRLRARHAFTTTQQTVSDQVIVYNSLKPHYSRNSLRPSKL